jgi:hypothetical protein
MLGHTYTVPMINQTVVADATLVIVRAAAAITTRASLLEVLRATVGQHGTTTPQNLGWQIGTYTSTAPVPHVVGGAASGIAGGTSGAAATSGTDASAEGAGTVTTIWEDGFTNTAGGLYVPTEDDRPLVTPDTAIIVKLIGTPTTLTNWHASLTFREVN